MYESENRRFQAIVPNRIATLREQSVSVEIYSNYPKPANKISRGLKI